MKETLYVDRVPGKEERQVVAVQIRFGPIKITRPCRWADVRVFVGVALFDGVRGLVWEYAAGREAAQAGRIMPFPDIVGN